MNFLNKYKYSFLFGLLGGLAFPPFYLIIFLPISFYYIINKINTLNNYKDIFKYSLIFGFGYYLIQLYWISFSLFVDIKSYFLLFPFALTLIPLACAFFIASNSCLSFSNILVIESIFFSPKLLKFHLLTIKIPP